LTGTCPLRSKSDFLSIDSQRRGESIHEHRQPDPTPPSAINLQEPTRLPGRHRGDARHARAVGDPRRAGDAGAWASSLIDADSATAQFWLMVAQHGFAYNLLIAEKVTPSKVDALRSKFQLIWTSDLDASSAAGNLYVIDMIHLFRQRLSCRRLSSPYVLTLRESLEPPRGGTRDHQLARGAGKAHFRVFPLTACTCPIFTRLL
jgi:hypothetical protein